MKNGGLVSNAGGVALDGVRGLVTGANRGLGRAFVDELLERDACVVYAAARNADSVAVDDDRIVPVTLDVTNAADVEAAAAACGDSALVINNAGLMLQSPFISVRNEDAARREMETNYFGTLEVARRFAPVLAANGGGALVNMLSIVSFYAVPFNASYCASKAAQWALTNALRIELNGQGTLVVGVHAGFIDTDMANGVDQPKVAPRDVARQALDAVEAGIPEVLADAETRWVKRAVPDDQTLLYPDLQRSWDAVLSPWNNTGSR
jgi:NAD(P)-dependent dehydrogenase (short-subunit alcohol dehydrogenase family)